MTAAECTLYAETLWISPYVFSSFVALQEKGVPFDVEEVALVRGEHFLPEYRDAAITARVPSLEHRGFRLGESSAIAEYLEEAYPAPLYPRLLPANVQERARARELMAWLRSDLAALRDERPSVTIFYPFTMSPLTAAARRDADKLLRIAEAVLPENGDTLFETWSLVDSELSFMLQRLIANGEAVPERVHAYARLQWERPSARTFVQHARPREVPESYWPSSGTPKPA